MAKNHAVKRRFYDDWRRIEPKLRTSIVEGISVFLSLFDDNRASRAPSARRPSVTRTLGKCTSIWTMPASAGWSQEALQNFRYTTR